MVKRAVLGIVVALGLGACNPLITDPVSLGGEFEHSAARYTGTATVWVEVAVVGAPEHAVYAFALIDNDDLHGPTQRFCAVNTVVLCDVTTGDVRMTNQQLVAGDGSQSVRLMTAWPDETVQVILVCVEPTSQELGCPSSVRMVLSAKDAQGQRVGDLRPGTLAG